MPTAYTCGVKDGTILTFREYALQCARAFVACIELRDDPLSPDIPEFKASTYHAENATREREDLIRVSHMTTEESQAACDAEYAAACESRLKSLARIAEQRERYEAMLAKAKAFVPPTSEHVEYAKFLVTQLEDSINWDCSTDYYTEAVKKTAAEWRREKMSSLVKSINYHEDEQEKENERTSQRNQWVKALKTQLDNCK